MQHHHQVGYDDIRDKRLLELGYETFRVTHYQVMTDIVNVSKSIEGKVIERGNLLGFKPIE